MKLKKIISGTVLTAVFLTATIAPVPIYAQTTSDNSQRVELQQQIISLLQQLVILLTAQVDGEMMKDDMMSDEMTMKDGVYTLTLDTDLADLDEGYYEGWLIVGDDKISTGLFRTGGEHTMVFDTPISDIEKVVITVEPEVDTDPGPSGIIVLAGDVNSGEVELAFPLDFSDASGSAILATPTDGTDEDETSGVWFLSVPGPEAALELPELPTGWVYEGWAVHDGMPLTTGRFTEVNAADDFDGYSGVAVDAPPFPGEDFLRNQPDGIEFPIDLADGESLIVISVEPDIDGVDPTGDGPAQVKPLVTEVEAGQADHENILLGLNLDSLPSGSATLK